MASKKGVQEFAVTLPFSIGIDGAVMGTTDQSKIWQDRVLAAVSTAFGERVLNYTYGSSIYTEVFNNQESAVKGITTEITKVFNVFFPLLTLNNIKTNFNSDAGSLSVEVIYALPNSEVNSVTIGTVSLNGQFPNSEGI